MLFSITRLNFLYDQGLILCSTWMQGVHNANFENLISDMTVDHIGVWFETVFEVISGWQEEKNIKSPY